MKQFLQSELCGVHLMFKGLSAAKELLVQDLFLWPLVHFSLRFIYITMDGGHLQVLLQVNSSAFRLISNPHQHDLGCFLIHCHDKKMNYCILFFFFHFEQPPCPWWWEALALCTITVLHRRDNTMSLVFTKHWCSSHNRSSVHQILSLQICGSTAGWRFED